MGFTGVTLAPTFIASMAIFGALLAAIVPTCLYLYVEPRGRLAWAKAADVPAARRAPVLVRVTAWLSFALGQLAVPWLLVPVACGVLLYLQAKLGLGRRPLDGGAVITFAIGAMALLQSLLTLRLLPIGVRLLMRDPRLCEGVQQIARVHAVGSALLLAAAASLGWAATFPWLVHPWLRAALVWTAVRPVTAYALGGLAQAWLLTHCERVLVDARPHSH